MNTSQPTPAAPRNGAPMSTQVRELNNQIIQFSVNGEEIRCSLLPALAEMEARLTPLKIGVVRLDELVHLLNATSELAEGLERLVTHEIDRVTLIKKVKRIEKEEEQERRGRAAMEEYLAENGIENEEAA